MSGEHDGTTPVEAWVFFLCELTGRMRLLTIGLDRNTAHKRRPAKPGGAFFKKIHTKRGKNPKILWNCKNKYDTIK